MASDPRRVLVSYHPTEVGGYIVEVMWSDHPVPGSPFSLYITHTSPHHMIKQI